MEIEKELDDNSMDEDDEVEGEEVYGDKQLDVEGLARAYKKINSTFNNEFYKNVLCLAISSLCGKYLNLKNYIIHDIKIHISFLFFSKNHCRITLF
jgi:hypothetical protein